MTLHGCVFALKELQEQHLAFRNSLICAFHQLLDLKDISTGSTARDWQSGRFEWARKLNIPDEHMYQVEVAALLHDIGKLACPRPFSRNQGHPHFRVRAVINRHSEYSWSILRLLPGLEDASLYALHHHENVDGTRYPAALKSPRYLTGLAHRLSHRCI